MPGHPRGTPAQDEPQHRHRRTAPGGDERHQRFGQLRQYVRLLSVTVYIDKVRFKHLGSGYTHAKFVYNRINGRYWPCEEDIVHGPDGDKPGPVNTKFDNENWLKNNSDQGCLFD